MICTWFANNIVGIVGIVVGAFIAYHVYFLSRKIDLRDRLDSKQEIQKVAEKITYGRKVEILNSKKYDSHYPSDNSKNKDGYTYLAAEYKRCLYDGVEFFCGMPKGVYERSDGTFSLKPESESQEHSFLIFPVGLIPYEWILFVNLQGDEHAWRPQFFTKFKGKDNEPYREIYYYELSDTYREGSDPKDFQYKHLSVEVAEF